MSEASRLERLRRLFAAGGAAVGVEVGIGDDAAVLAGSRESLVWTLDSAVEGVHFRRAWVSLNDIGWRSTMAAASDLAAMGARPRGILSALTLPVGFQDFELDALAQGQADAALALGTAVVGGNLARGSELSITTTVLGQAPTPLLRSGSTPGDVVAVAGALGLASLGLQALMRDEKATAPAQALSRFRRPEALIREGIAARSTARAAIDVSDGLVLDASRLAEASGVGIVLEPEKVLWAGGPHLVDAAAHLALSPLDLALYGGEDYALLMTFPSDARLPEGFVAIGTCTAGSGVHLQKPTGLVLLEPRGFDHFEAPVAKSTSI